MNPSVKSAHADGRMTPADRFWLRMDSPANLMMINGVMVFDEPLELGRVRALIEERLLPIPRFRQRIAEPQGSGRPRWETDPDFDLDHHLRSVRLDPPGDEAVLRDYISGWMSVPLDHRRPMWSFHLLEGLGDGCAILCRFHHSLGDGIALMMVFLSLTDMRPDGTMSDNPFGAMFRDDPEELEKARIETARIMPEGMALMTKPAEAWGSIPPVVRGAASTSALGKVTFRLNDRRQLFRAPVGEPKRVAWSDALPLTEVKRASRGLGCTINDLLTAAVAGGVRRYMLDTGHPRGARDFRAVVPVNVRSLEEMADLGNKFGLVFLSMPVGIADPLERVAEVRRRMSRLKRSAEPFVVFGLLSLVGRLPASIQGPAVKMFMAKASAVMTNVPGPRDTLYVTGKPVRDLFFWVPQSGRLSIGISILSYAGNVRLGIATDQGLVPDPERIVDGFQLEVEDLYRLADAAETGRA
jgi:WS/DGAT/MGAT family acyltransferase